MLWRTEAKRTKVDYMNNDRCDLIRLERTNMVTKMEDRIKVGLSALSKIIMDNLALCNPDSLAHDAAMINRMAVQFNQGSLLQYQFGEIEKAEILCHREIELFADLSSRSEHKALCLANMVPPYINLARIYGQKGEVTDSLSIFEEVYRFGVQQEDLCIFGYYIPVTEGPAMFAAAQGYEKVMVSCGIIEAARVLQTVEDYPTLLKLVVAIESLPQYQDRLFKQYLLEARSRALLRLGQYEAALETFSECCNLMPGNTTDRIVAHTLLSQIYREWGCEDPARETLNKLEGHLAAVEKFGRKLPVIRQILYRLALERYAMGDYKEAIGPAEKSFKWCTELNDEPGSIKTAILLLRLCGDKSKGSYSSEKQRHWYNELKQLAATTSFKLERAFAYWELGLAVLAESDNDDCRESACDFLQRSYNFYRSIPFVDSRQSCDSVKKALDCLAQRLPARSASGNGRAGGNNSEIESTFDALMEYEPKPFVTTH